MYNSYYLKATPSIVPKVLDKVYYRLPILLCITELSLYHDVQSG